MPAPPDSWITTTIQSKCFLSSALQAEQVEVSTHGGAVTLTGHVRNAAARAAAEEIARGTQGVRSVVNRIAVAGS
jgi:hyperosmotically inducible protein